MSILKAAGAEPRRGLAGAAGRVDLDPLLHAGQKISAYGYRTIFACSSLQIGIGCYFLALRNSPFPLL